LKNIEFTRRQSFLNRKQKFFLPNFLSKMAMTLIGPLLILMAWTISSNIIDNQIILPSTKSVFQLLLTPTEPIIGIGSLLTNMKISLIRVFLGYILAVAIAVPLGVLVGYSKIANNIVNPTIGLFRPIPPLAWVPLVLAWFGTTSIATIIGLETGNLYIYLNNFRLSMMFIIFLGAFFPIVTSSIYGVANVQKQLLESVRVLGASEWGIFRKVLIPSAMPTIVNGMRTGLGVGWTCLVSAEMLPGSLSGAGYLITHAYEVSRVDVVMAGMICIGIVGALLDQIFRFIEERKFAW